MIGGTITSLLMGWDRDEPLSYPEPERSAWAGRRVIGHGWSLVAGRWSVEGGREGGTGRRIVAPGPPPFTIHPHYPQQHWATVQPALGPRPPYTAIPFYFFRQNMAPHSALLWLFFLPIPKPIFG